MLSVVISPNHASPEKVCLTTKAPRHEAKNNFMLGSCWRLGETDVGS
jgi:hypothetical protein